MEKLQDSQSLLAHLQAPAFTVIDGSIAEVNEAAQRQMISVGTQILPLLLTGKEEYSALSEGSLFLTLDLSGVATRCSVTAFENCHLFTIDETVSVSELQILALAAQQLCIPLSDVSLLINTARNEEEQGRLNQQLFRMQRIVGNMADAATLLVREPRMESCNLTGELAEILEKSKTLLAFSGISLEYRMPEQPVSTYADIELLRRALYNLLSNAAKFTTPEKKIRVVGTLRKNYFSITVQNYCKKSKKDPQNLFRRYERKPALEDPRFGLGLGMTLIHAAAAAHGGTVLVENQTNQTKVTISISLREIDDTALRTPILRPDIYGGRDQALVELSDVLSSTLYNEKRF